MEIYTFYKPAKIHYISRPSKFSLWDWQSSTHWWFPTSRSWSMVQVPYIPSRNWPS